MNRENHRQTFSPKQISGLGVVKTAHRTKLIKKKKQYMVHYFINWNTLHYIYC